jgi:hypothetical protein
VDIAASFVPFVEHSKPFVTLTRLEMNCRTWCNASFCDMLINAEMNDIFCGTFDDTYCQARVRAIIVVRITYDLVNIFRSGSSDNAENFIQNIQVLEVEGILGQACL